MVLWQAPLEFDSEIQPLLAESLLIVLAKDGVLNTNYAIRESGDSKVLVILAPQINEKDQLAISLRARFAEYRTTTEAQLLKELGWPPTLENWIRSNGAVLSNPRAFELLKRINPNDINVGDVNKLVIGRLFNVDDRSEVGLSLAIFGEGQKRAEEMIDLVSGLDLEVIIWQTLAKELEYRSERPSLEDLRIWLAQAILSASMVNLDLTRSGSQPSGSTEYFLHELKLRFPAEYASFCELVVAPMVSISELEDLTPQQLSRVQHLPQVDPRLLGMCLNALSASERTMTSEEVEKVMLNRNKSSWFAPLEGAFTALLNGARVLEQVKAVNLHCSDFGTAVGHYVTTWHQVDSNYRKFVLFSKGRADTLPGFDKFVGSVEDAYVNGFQDKLGGTWQVVLENLESWQGSSDAPLAKEFYYNNVLLPLSDKKSKIAVIISDALRFEIGVEIAGLLSESGFDVKVSPMISPLPSYTQLGMAALLPNESIKLQPETKTVLVDDEPSSGIENRKKILQKVGGSALDFESLITSGALKEDLAHFQLWYVYHNQIDKVGDNSASEGTVFEAVERTFDDIKVAVEKLKVAGFNKIFITADHGFLYQDSTISEHGFLSTVPEGEVTEFMNRRFIIGTGLTKSDGLKHFTSSQLGYECDYEIQIPASSLRLRRKGSGLRFVHGGASLQEAVVPLLELTKSAKGFIQPQVDVVLSPGSSTRITTGVVSLSFTQKEPVSDELASRELRIAIFAGEQRISTPETLVFSSSDAEIRNRTSAISLSMLNGASIPKGSKAILKLESRIGQTGRWATYAEIEFELANIADKDF